MAERNQFISLQKSLSKLDQCQINQEEEDSHAS
jgi:hypothetical protein